MGIYSRYASKIRWKYRKNRADMKGILGGYYPDFVLPGKEKALQDEIPVFFFHEIEPEPFRAKLQYLKRNEYTTLTGNELLRVIEGKKSVPERAVALTFDDGMASLYTVAFPLLKEFDFRAISFIIPGCIPDSAPETPTYEDVKTGQASLGDLLRRESGAYPLCSWQEIEEMHASGHIDFQAHSMHHHLIHVSPHLVDFIHPGYDRHPADFNVPAYPVNGCQGYTRDVGNGAPVFWAESRLSGMPQYFDNEEVRNACLEFVENRGGETFFENRGWRRRLTRLYREEKRRSAPGAWETEEEMRQEISSEIAECKKVIEQKIPGTTVDHFCFPWFVGSEVAVREAREAGYRALYWGMLGDERANRPGGDLMRISRLENIYIYRLPGKGRKSLSSLLWNKAKNIIRT
jgi:peptidoglycan/xylan/chitin deacetylase (PgdA/CDA1 family)